MRGVFFLSGVFSFSLAHSSVRTSVISFVLPSFRQRYRHSDSVIVIPKLRNDRREKSRSYYRHSELVSVIPKLRNDDRRNPYKYGAMHR